MDPFLFPSGIWWMGWVGERGEAFPWLNSVLPENEDECSGRVIAFNAFLGQKKIDAQCAHHPFPF